MQKQGVQERLYALFFIDFKSSKIYNSFVYSVIIRIYKKTERKPQKTDTADNIEIGLRKERKTMSDLTRIVVDAMGGDYAPEWIVRGAVEAVNEGAKAQIILTGKEDAINKELEKYTYNKERIEVKNASEEITCHDAPVQAVRSKKDSSLVVGLNMVKNGEADAIISAGSSGAILAGGQLVVGRAKGVKRSPLAPLLPTSNGYSLLIDCGANAPQTDLSTSFR